MLALHARNVAGVLALPVRVTEPDIPLLCRRLRTLLALSGPGPVVCDAALLACPDLVTVDALARLQLTAARGGAKIVIAGGSPELRRLLCSTGLSDVLLLSSRSALQMIGQAEQGEVSGGVEEEADPADPAP